MAFRTDQTEVGNIIELDLDTFPGLMTPCLTFANELVTERCTDSGYSDTRLALIECWLCAHLVATIDPRVSSEEAKDVRVWYQSKVDLGLSLTHYGQQVMILDTAGNLAGLNNKMKTIKGIRPSIKWIGKKCS